MLDYHCIFVDNYINGKEFLKLNEQDIKEMINAVGITQTLFRIVSKVLILYARVINCTFNYVLLGKPSSATG